MKRLSPEQIWNLSESKLIGLIDSETFVKKPKKIQFYAPSFTYYKTSSFCSSSKDFPTISITGNTCALKCKHCAGKVLETMHPALTPEKLVENCAKFKQNGARGVLISGGCMPDGSIPFYKFGEALSRVKEELDLTVFVHSGILSLETAKLLKEAKVDAALIDIIGSDQTISEIYNLNISTRDYADSLSALQNAKIDFVPHVITGLHEGSLKGEYDALKIISRFKPSAVVVISFMPIRGTLMEKTIPPAPIDIARTIATARVFFPETPLVLGCMRPKGKHRAETDLLALKSGVDGIAFPNEGTIKYSEKAEYKISYSSFCCAQIYKDLVSK
jgi:uncharacterized radical SAM superfamily protein